MVTDIRSRSTRMDEATRDRILRRYAARRDPRDLERLVVSYRALAHSLARRYTTDSMPDADLEQAACEGLVKAIQRYDPTRGVPFTSFALPTILGEVRRYLRDTAWNAHVPRSLKERVRTLMATRDRLVSEQGHAPSATELAAELDWSPEEVVEALSASAARAAVPLETSAEDEDGSLLDRFGHVDPGFDLVDCSHAVASALPKLPVDERRVIHLRFGGDLTQRQIASELGFSRSHVGRLLSSGLDRLRAEAA